ncbi:hypothetical protein ACH6CV_06745 [Bacillota bacterium Meth-B3]|nr:hypothetical protein [Christensenellaceae bacterium]MEA5065840.1 hypothetical protein [Eubacteriales bacterium]MEA5069686.1 hypothetical protein [Christensenellaceae bacterium]
MSLDRRRALGPYLWGAALFGLLLQLHSVSYLLTGREGEALMAFFFSSSMGFVAPVMPLLSALPFATGFCADWRSGFAAAAVSRSGKRRYLHSKAAACALSGALASALGMLAFVVFLNLWFPPDWSREPFIGDIEGLETLLLGGGAGAYLKYYGARLLLASCSGAFWALSALAFSAFYPNVPLTLCAPLVLHRLLQELGQALLLPPFLDVTLLETGAAGLPPPLTLAAGAIVFGVLCAALWLTFALRAGRRLRNA